MITNPFRMERLLEFWEDRWWLLGMSTKLFAAAVKEGARGEYDGKGLSLGGLKQMSPLNSWPKFRGALASIDLQAPCKSGVHQSFLSNCKTLSLFPTLDQVAESLWFWSLASKRIYQMTQDLQLLLGATSVGKMKWSDVEIPFPCFAVSLSQPIRNGDREYDLIIVRKADVAVREGGSLPGLTFTLISSRLAAYQAFSPVERQELCRLVSSGPAAKAVRLYNRYDTKVTSFSSVFEFGAPGIEHSKLAAQVEPEQLWNATGSSPATKFEDGSTHHQVLTATLRAVAGLCLYLQTLPVGSVHRKKEVSPVAPEVRGTSVTRGQHFLTVMAEQTLTSEERTILSSPGNEIGGERRGPRGSLTEPHFRSGYWHRPRGKGGDPSFPKIEKTKWTIVRRDLGLPALASQTTLK